MLLARTDLIDRGPEDEGEDEDDGVWAWPEEDRFRPDLFLIRMGSRAL